MFTGSDRNLMEKKDLKQVLSKKYRYGLHNFKIIYI